MARRVKAPYDGKRYLGNMKGMKVHDLDRENTTKPGCQIDDVKLDNIRMFDTVSQANQGGLKECSYCFKGFSHPHSKRNKSRTLKQKTA